MKTLKLYKTRTPGLWRLNGGPEPVGIQGWFGSKAELADDLAKRIADNPGYLLKLGLLDEQSFKIV